MNATKQTKQKTFDFSPLGTKKKGKRDDAFEPEPMVLLPADPGESVTKYSLALSSANKDKTLDEMEMLRNITKHLHEIVHTMESVYIHREEIKEEEEEEEEEAVGEEPSEDHEDMTSFLICCSQLRTQLEITLSEEKQILESLFKWFEKEVREMEELGEEELISDWQIPLADKSITDNINKLLDRIQRLEELKGRVQELPKLVHSISKQEKKKAPVSPATAQKDPKNIIEELATKHASEDVMNMVQVFQDDSGQPETIEMMNNRMVEIMKVFERQTNKLHRVVNEQDVLEGKLQKIQQEFRKIADEKEIMEDELQKMKTLEQEKRFPDSRKKMLSKLEKGKGKVEQLPPSEKDQQAQKPESLSAKKMKDELTKAQENIHLLEKEKKVLEEKLKKALEEVEKAKIQLAEIPPTIPEFSYSAAGEDVPKKGKKTAKSKTKGDDLRQISITETDKLQRAGTGKAGEVPSGKILQKVPASGMEKLSKQASQDDVLDKKTEEPKKVKAEMVDSKGMSKSKETSEMKSRYSKGAEKDASIQEKQQLPELAKDEEKVLPVILDKPVEILPRDSKEGKTEIPVTMSPQLSIKEEHLPSTEPKTLPVTSDFEMEDSAKFKPLTSQTGILSPDTDSVGSGEEESSHLISEDMLQLADHLSKLKEIPAAETIAKLLLKPDKEELPETQEHELLLILNQLITPDELQQAGETMEDERKTTLLANIASTIRLLQQEQFAEDDLSEEGRNDLAQEKTAILSTLDSFLKDYQLAQAGSQTQQDIGWEIEKLSEKRTLLLANLELNKKDLEEAQVLASTHPSEMNENKVKELLQQREQLVAKLETNEEMQKAGFLKEKNIDKLSKQRDFLLASLKTNVKELEEAEALAVAHKSSLYDNQIKELTEERNQLTTHLDANLQNTQRTWLSAQRLVVESRPQEEELNELQELSAKKQQLVETLESNQKELQDLQELAATQPGIVSDHKLQELTEQKKRLTIDLVETLDDIQNICCHASERTGFVGPPEKELHELHDLSEKKQQIIETLDFNWKELQVVQELATAQPDSVSEHTLQELNEQRRCLIVDLEATLDGIQNVCRRASERISFAPPPELELHELHDLSEKKQWLLEALKANQKELQEIQELAAAQPGSVSEHQLQELTEEKKCLTTDLEATLYGIQNVYRRASERTSFVPHLEKELHELHVVSEKKQQLLEALEFNQKELQEMQELAAAQPGSVSEHKLQELIDQRRHLTADLEAVLDDIQSLPHPRVLERKKIGNHWSKKLLEALESNQKEVQEIQELAAAQPGSVSEKELPELPVLSEKKQQLLEALESNQKELQEIQELAAAQPGSVSEHKLQELSEERRCLTLDLEATLDGIENVCRLTLEKTSFVLPQDKSKAFLLAEKQLHKLFVKKKELLEKLESNQRELECAQVLSDVQLGVISDHMLQELAQQRRSLITDLETTMYEIQNTQEIVSEGVSMIQPAERELYELHLKKQEKLEKLNSVQKELDEALALEATQPGSINESKRYKLAEEKRHLTEELGQTMHDLQIAEGCASERSLTGKSTERGLYDLSVEKKELQEKLKSNQKELDEAQALAAAQPGSINEHKLQELAEQRRQLIVEANAIEENIEKAHHASVTPQLQRTVKELNELLEKKQLAEEYLESNLNALQKAQSLAAAYPDTISEHTLQELSEERRHLSADLKAIEHYIQKTEHALKVAEIDQSSEEKQKELAEQKILLAAELDATKHGIRRAEHHISGIPLDIKPSDIELYGLLEKKYMLLEDLAFNQKQLMEIQAHAVVQPDSSNDNKLQELTKERKHLTEDLKATVDNIEVIQRSSSEKIHITRPNERQFTALSEKRQHLLESLEFKEKELEEAKTLQPDSVSVQKLQEIRSLSLELESTVHGIQKIEPRASKEALMGRSEQRFLLKLGLWKILLLEHLESHIKQQEEIEDLQPDSTTEKKMQELNEQGKLLTENLEEVVQDIQETKAHISETGGIIKYVERDIDELYQKKVLFSERLEKNLKKLQEAHTHAATHPSSISEQKCHALTNQRRLLAAGLEAIIQDLQDRQGTPIDKIKIKNSKEKVLEELVGRKELLLENLTSNLKSLKQAQALAAAQPNSFNEQKVQDLTDQRRLLSLGLEVMMKNIQDLQSFDASSIEILKPSELELQELSEKRRLHLENMESNLKDLKALQTAAVTQPDEMREEIVQEIAEKKIILADSLDRILQDMEQAENLDIENEFTKRADERKVHELIVLSTLESKLIELEEVGALSNNQLDIMRSKVHNLKERRSITLPREYPEAMLDKQKEAVEEFIEQKKHLLSYLKSSIKNLHEKGIIQEDTMPEKAIQDLSEEKIDLNKYLMIVPVDLLQSEADALSAKLKSDDEKTAKQRDLAAKLEENARDVVKEKIGTLQHAESKKYLPASVKKEINVYEPLNQHLFAPSFTGLQGIKVPLIRRIKFDETSLEHTKPEVKPTSSFLEPQDKIIMDIALQEILDYNKNLLPGHRTNVQQALQHAQQELQKQTNALAEKFKAMSLFLPQPHGTTRFQDYTFQTLKPAWEANQLPQKGNIPKLNLLKRRLLGLDVKGGTSPLPFQRLSPLTNQTQELDSFVICGRGCNPRKTQRGSTVLRQKLRNN